MARTGANGLPVALNADWNDCIGLGNTGESMFVAFQVRHGLVVYREICARLGRDGEAAWAQTTLADFDARIARVAWDGQWWRRGIHGDGRLAGSHEQQEGSIFVEPQPWAVIAGVGTREQQLTALDSVNERLATEHGIMLCAPPFRKDRSCVAVIYNAGQKENCAIFQHPQGWVVIAEAMLGRGDRAYEYFRAYMPAASNEHAEVRESEPYVWCQSTHGKFSRLFGKARVPWLSGTATWSLHAATHFILGVQPDYDGLRIRPVIPAAWDGFKVTRRFRGATYRITVKNPKHVCAGATRMKVDGRTVDGDLAPLAAAGSTVKVDVVLE
jgi:N,N'-diacetylchitobiose phosphorylase